MVAVHVATMCVMLPYHRSLEESPSGLQNLHIICSEVQSNASDKLCISYSLCCHSHNAIKCVTAVVVAVDNGNA